ncbi:MAG: nuclear transport factor 2 family protein [Candidatus Acidiferrales bacterium]
MSSESGKGPHSSDQNGGDIRLMREKWVEAFNRRDVEGVVSFYAEDAVELPLNGAPAVSGIAAIRELVKSMFAAGFSELKVRQTQVGYTEPLGVELATYAVKSRAGQTQLWRETGRLVATWRRGENGEFKITISVWSRELSDAQH